MESIAPSASSAPAPTTRFNRRTGTKNFSIYEDKRLFLILQQVLPKHYSDWQKVYDSYNLNKPEDFRERSVDSLHNRFRNLLKKSNPNGNKAVPANVRFAREIQRKILNRPIIDDDIETRRTATRAQGQSEVAIERDDASGYVTVSLLLKVLKFNDDKSRRCPPKQQ
ncbi:hypothetical protein K3495_g8590 [Podosphaera aphanis]|nr:hypothetical protein K3495_g8590 [Podosphaera aphanis]